MTELNEYHLQLANMLAEIQGSDKLRQFVGWRRRKGKVLAAIEREEESHPCVADYWDDLEAGFEQLLLDYVMKENAQDQVVRRARFRELKKMEKANDNLEPFIANGVTITIDNLVAFYDELDKLQRSSKPARFARRTKAAFDRESVSDIVKIGKAEQRFYGGLAIASKSLGLDVSNHDYVPAVDHRRRRVTWNTRIFYGLFVMASLSVGALTMYAGLTFFSPKREEISDALADEVALYIEEDHLVESDLELQLEQIYGFNIVGEFAQEDLDSLSNQLGNSYPPEMVRTLELRRIVIFDESEQEQVDYWGSASRGRGEIRLFSGHLGAVVDHEVAHFQTFTHQGALDKFVARWQDLAGPYENGVIVTYTRGPAERGSAATNLRYVSGADPGTPFHGYMRAYGGVNYREDISTFVQAIRGNPALFARVTGDFHIYRQKLGLLREYHYISDTEYTDAMGQLQVAEDGEHVEFTSHAPSEVE